MKSLSPENADNPVRDYLLRPSKKSDMFILSEPGKIDPLEFPSIHAAFLYAKGRTHEHGAELRLCDNDGNVLRWWRLNSTEGP